MTDTIPDGERKDAGRRTRDRGFREALLGSKVFLATTDRQRRYTWAFNPDPAFDPAGLIGKRDEELAPLEGMTGLVRLKERVLASAEAAREVVEVLIGGQPRFFDVQVQPKRDAESGELTGVAIVSVDVTEPVREEEARVGYLEEVEERLRRTIRRQQASLGQRDRQVDWLSTQLTRVEQRERQRLARLLHDELQQLLVAASLQAETLMESGVVRHDGLQQLEGLLDDAQQVSRDLVTRLSPPILDGAPLSDVFTWLAEQMHRLHGLSVRLEAEEDLEPENDSLRRLLFDVGREMLLNVVKHAGVRSCSLRLGTTGEGWVRLEVEDEGKGIDAREPPDAEHPDAFGLFSMRRRVEAIGGSTVIRSGPGKGVLARVELPPGAFQG